MSMKVRSAAAGSHLPAGISAMLTTIMPIATSWRLRAASAEPTAGASTVRSKRALLVPQASSAAVRIHQASLDEPCPRSATRAAKTAVVNAIEPRVSSTRAANVGDDAVNSERRRSLEEYTSSMADPVMSPIPTSPNLAPGP